MTTYTEGYRASEIILSEAPGTLSRETVAIASGAGVITAGLVLGKVTASGKYAPYDDDNDDGTQTAVCIALESVDATSAEKTCAALFRLAEFKADILQWASTNDAGDKTAGLDDLAAKYLIGR
jgi:hypothetical protein